MFIAAIGLEAPFARPQKLTERNASAVVLVHRLRLE